MQAWILGGRHTVSCLFCFYLFSPLSLGALLSEGENSPTKEGSADSDIVCFKKLGEEKGVQVLEKNSHARCAEKQLCVQGPILQAQDFMKAMDMRRFDIQPLYPQKLLDEVCDPLGPTEAQKPQTSKVTVTKSDSK